MTIGSGRLDLLHGQRASRARAVLHDDRLPQMLLRERDKCLNITIIATTSSLTDIDRDRLIGKSRCWGCDYKRCGDNAHADEHAHV
jgi:hypothetical protein